MFTYIIYTSKQAIPSTFDPYCHSVGRLLQILQCAVLFIEVIVMKDVEGCRSLVCVRCDAERIMTAGH